MWVSCLLLSVAKCAVTNKKEEKRSDADPSPRIPIGSFDVDSFFSHQRASSAIRRKPTIQSML
jgi:hypothetical protein